jgi:hypothetical protein
VELRSLFGSAVAGWVIGGIATIGGILTALDQFRFAEITWGAAAVVGLAWLWYQPYKGSRFDLAIVAVIFAVATLLCYSTERYRIKRILSENHGLLIAANDSQIGCDSSPDIRTVIVGDMAFAAPVTGFPIDIVQLHYASLSTPTPLLTMSFTDGSLGIIASFTSQDGRIIAAIKDNQWIVNPNNILNKENEDLSSLKVTDQTGETVLNVRYSNPSVIEVRNIALHYKQVTVIGNRDGVYINGHRALSGFCMEMQPNASPGGGQRGAFIGIQVH